MQFYYICVIILLEKSLVIFLMKYYVDFKIENNDEKILKNNIEAIYKNNNLKFNYDEESIEMIIKNNNIIMTKENNDSIITFDFKLNKKTESKYYIKDLNFYIDTKVLTNKLDILDDKIYIEYELWLSEERAGIFKYEVNIKGGKL